VVWIGWVLGGFALLAFLVCAWMVIETTVRHSADTCPGDPAAGSSGDIFRIRLGRYVLSVGSSVLWHPWFRRTTIVDPAQVVNGEPVVVGRGFQTPLFRVSFGLSWPYPWTEPRNRGPRPLEPERAKLTTLDERLLRAVDDGKPDLVEELVKAGANMEARDEHGSTPLMRACMHGNTDMVRQLIRLGADVQACDDHGGSPLLFASLDGDAEAVAALLEKGAHPNDHPVGAVTPLMFAVDGGSLPVGRLLLQHGADANAYEGQTTEGSALLRAVRGRGRKTPNIGIVEALLDSGAEVNVRDRYYGHTPLMTAAGFGNLPLVRLLVSRGADPTLRAKNGMTALDRARLSKCCEVADFLTTEVAGRKEAGPPLSPADSGGS
jgi:ankyrin repeat protein